MNTKVAYPVFLFSIFLSGYCLADDAKLNEDRIKARQIWDGVVNHNEKDALLETNSLEPSLVVPMLYRFANDKTTDPELAAIAINALRNLNGYTAYFRQDMAEATAQGSIPGSDFEILRIIATPEAARVVAPYLFDFKTIIPRDGDVAGASSIVVATSTLEGMQLADAPKGKNANNTYFNRDHGMAKMGNR